MNLGTNSTGLGISSITAISGTTAWISAYPETAGTGGIWKTIDAGVTWTRQSSALFSNVNSYTNFVHFWDANNGIAQGDPESVEFEIYNTTDGGATWNRVNGANIPNPNINEAGYDNLYSVSGNTIWFGTDAGRIFKSTDKGLTWTVTQSPSIDFGLDRFTFSDINKGLLMINNPAALYKTTDGGTTWNLISATGFFNNEIAYIPSTSLVISVATSNPYGSSYSTDNGLTWTSIDAVYHGTLAFLNSSFGFSSSINTSAVAGGIFKYTGTQLAVPNFEIKKTILVYPNPTAGSLQLNSASSLLKEVAVFDLLGKQVYNSKFSALDKVDLNLKSLQTGTYVLKATSVSGKTESIKFMKK